MAVSRRFSTRAASRLISSASLIAASLAALANVIASSLISARERPLLR